MTIVYTPVRLAALLAGASLSATAAMAQAPATQAAAETGGAFEEIIVTAQKRGENLQRAPLAISAISAQKADLIGITEVRDISGLAPNVSISQGTTNATAAVVTIRGIPTAADETQGYDSPIGLYLDGVYLARSSAASFEVAEIERIEVLRGPQGTLFGRNTTGGAINFITKQPDDEFGLKVRAGYGNYNQWTGRAILNTGKMGDTLSATLSYLHKQRDGVVDNLLQPKKSQDPGGNNTDAFRIAVKFEPSDSITITNIFDYTVIDGVPHANQLAGVGAGVFRPNVTLDGGSIAQVQPANVAGYLGQASTTALEPGCGKPVQRARLDSICLEGARSSRDKLWGNLLRVEVDVGPVKLRSSTSYREWDNNIQGSDLDGLGTVRGAAFTNASLLNGMPASLLQFVVPPGAAGIVAGLPVPTTTQPLFQAKNLRSQQQFSQELEIISNYDSDFQWVIGGFYFHEEGSESNEQSFGFILDTNQIFLANFGALGPGFAAANPARFRNFSTPSSTLAYKADADSFAVYGQGSWRPGGAEAPFGVTLGLRYTWDKKGFDRSQNGATPFTASVDLGLNRQRTDFGKPTGHVTVDYRATDDVNLYGRIARGYRSGGFNARQTTNAAANLGLIPFNEETIWSYELGAKTELFDRLRLNAAVFYNEYSDLQATIPIPGGATFGTQVTNAGKINYTGVELEGQLAITENLSVDGSFGYVHKDVKNFPGADITGVIRNIASVITPGNSPDYTANLAGNLVFPLGDTARLTARVGWSYVSSQFFFANPLTAPFNEDIKADPRSLFDAQLRIDNIQFGGVGKGMAVTLWGKNITNSEYIARGIDFGQIGYGSVIYGDPATYGITVDFEF
ncbi:MAG: TonB-dependent receptor [Polymorphobacter sp.]